MVKLLRDNHSISLLTNVSVAFFGFLTFLVLVRTYSAESFGLWLLYLTPLTFAEMIKTGLVKNSIVRYLSGADETEKKQIIGSGWILGLSLTTILALVVVLTNIFFHEPIKGSSYQLFFIYYPFYTFLSLPLTNTLGILEARQNFPVIFLLRSLSTALFFAFVMVNFFVPRQSISDIIVGHLIVNTFVSALTIAKGWGGISYFSTATKDRIKSLLNYGKYSVGTVLGSNLLKSSDTIIIGLSPLGPASVAMYSVPLKLIEVMDIPLRSLVMNAFPKLSQASIKGDYQLVKRLFYQYSGSTSLLFIPGLIICVVFARYLILLIGGEQYVQSQTVIILFQIFVFYSLLLPIDRFSGITLDSINKPNLNLIKVLIMATLNIIGDLISVFVFKSVIGVAVVTVFFTLIGQYIGYRYLKRELNIEYHLIFISGYEFFVHSIRKFFKTNHQISD